jgi:hypothetical protein
MLGGAAGNPRDAKSSCIALDDLHCGIGAPQTDRVLPAQQRRTAIFSAGLRRAFYLACPVRLYTRATVLAPFCFRDPSYLHSRTADSPTSYWRPFFSEAFSFSISKVRLTRRCGSMQQGAQKKIKGKLNCLDSYFLGSPTRTRSSQNWAISSVA